jgi:hypothetical protein
LRPFPSPYGFSCAPQILICCVFIFIKFHVLKSCPLSLSLWLTNNLETFFVLFCSFSFQVLENFPVVFLWLISDLIMWWLENVLYVISFTLIYLIYVLGRARGYLKVICVLLLLGKVFYKTG